MSFTQLNTIHKGANLGSKITGLLVSGRVSRSGSVFWDSFSYNLVVAKLGELAVQDLVNAPDGEEFSVIVRDFNVASAQMYGESAQSLEFQSVVSKNATPVKSFSRTDWPWVDWSVACDVGDFTSFGDSVNAAVEGIAGTDDATWLLGFTTKPASFTTCSPRGPYSGNILFWFPNLTDPGKLQFGDQLIDPQVIIPKPSTLNLFSQSVDVLDTFANEALPDTPMVSGSDEDRLIIRDRTVGFRREAFIQFEIPERVTAVKSAILTLTYRLPDMPSSAADVDISTVPNPLDIDLLTWNNRPSPVDLIQSFDIPTSQAQDTEIQVDITNGVNFALLSSNTVSLILQNTSFVTVNFSFWSSRNTGGFTPPSLDIEFYA